jgi:DNA primase
MKLTDEELQKIRDVSIYKILGIHERGRRISMRCPFPGHRDSSPSFALYPSNSYNCFGCGESGQGAIDFCESLGFSFQESLTELIKYIV